MADRWRVLVIDDSPDNLELVELVLASAGYEVTTAPDGLRGLELVKRCQPDVVLLDMMMPELDGLQVLERLAALPRETRPAAVAMSGFDVFEADALARGAFTFLRKPVDPERLLAAVARAARGDRRRIPPDPAVELARADATRRRQELFATGVLELPWLRTHLRSTAGAARAYFGAGMAFVNLLRDGKVRIQAAAGGSPPLVEGAEIACERMFCSQVVTAGAPMVLGDAAASPIYRHHADAESGARFYAGSPIRTADGICLGTLCVVDGRPHVFHAEDLAILSRLAQGLARRIDRARRGELVDPTASAEVLDAELVGAIVDAELHRASRERSGAELAIVALLEENEETLGAAAAAAYDAAGRRRFAAIRHRSGLALVAADAGGGTGSPFGRLRAALMAVAERAPIAGIGVASFPEGRVVPPPAEDFVADAETACWRASERGGAAVERVVAPIAEERLPR